MTDCTTCKFKKQCDSYNANKDEEDCVCIIHEPIWLEGEELNDLSPLEEWCKRI